MRGRGGVERTSCFAEPQWLNVVISRYFFSHYCICLILCCFNISLLTKSCFMQRNWSIRKAEWFKGIPCSPALRITIAPSLVSGDLWMVWCQSWWRSIRPPVRVIVFPEAVYFYFRKILMLRTSTSIPKQVLLNAIWVLLATWMPTVHQ